MLRRRATRPVTAISPLWILTNSPFFLLFWLAVVWIAAVSVFTPTLVALYEPDFTLSNYVRVFTEERYTSVLLDTVGMALLGSTLSVVLGYPLALRISRSGGLTRSFYMGAVITVLLVAFLVKLYAWQILLTESSVVSQFLALLGAPTSLLGTKAGVILGLVYASLPYTTLSLLASIDQVPIAVEEAAATYGAAPLRRFFTVVVPLSSTGIATALVFAIPLNLSAFLAPLLLGRGKVQMTSSQIYSASASGGVGSNWPLAAALSMVLMAACVIFTLVALAVVQRQTPKGVS